MEINIDAKGAIVGRVGSFAAKQALLGHTVNIFNCEAAVISGTQSAIQEKYRHRIMELGQTWRGPTYIRWPDRMMRRLLRGMLNYKVGRGKEAYSRIKCYIGVPDEFKDKKLVKSIKQASELPNLKYQTLGQLCRTLGGHI